MAGGGNAKGYTDGQGPSAKFHYPEGIAYYQDLLYVSDSQNNVIRTVSLNGLVNTFAGSKKGSQDGNRFALVLNTDQVRPSTIPLSYSLIPVEILSFVIPLPS